MALVGQPQGLAAQPLLAVVGRLERHNPVLHIVKDLGGHRVVDLALAGRIVGEKILELHRREVLQVLPDGFGLRAIAAQQRVELADVRAQERDGGVTRIERARTV